MAPSLFAYAALLVWPIISLILFRTQPVGRALTWTVLGGYLLLPVGTEIKLEGIPKFDKTTIPCLAALVGCVIAGRERLRFRYGFTLTELLLLILLLSPIITSQLNSDPVIVAGRIIPGVGAYDGVSAVVLQFLVLLPFFLGRQFLRNPQENIDLITGLALAGLVYSLPVIFEIRMSPQLHAWIYGYFPHSFDQQIRDGGFRPVVFLGHGLVVAFFMTTAAIAATACWRQGLRIARLPPSLIVGYLAVILAMCKTLGALVYGLTLVPLVRYAKPQIQMRVALVLSLVALLYPLLRSADFFPTHNLIEAAATVSDDRAASLKFRFDNEDQLLERAWDRFAFGWGRYGRSRVYDDTTGNDISVTDGHWIITIGQFGFVGFLGEFGLLCLSVATAAAARKFVQTRTEAIFLCALALIVAISMIDLLPNSSLSPWTWLLAGALLGRAEQLKSTSRPTISNRSIDPLYSRRATAISPSRHNGRRESGASSSRANRALAE